MSKFVVHQSSLKTWRRCRRQYYYKYVLNLERVRREPPLIRGSVVHEMIQAKVNGQDPFEPLQKLEERYAHLFADEREYYGDLPGEVRRLMTGYFAFYKNDPLRAVEVDGVAAEYEFRVSLTASIDLAGKIDRFGQDNRGHRWIVDVKTHKTLPRGDVKYADLQSALYTHASPIEVVGMIWDYISWQPPAIPQVLKSGEMSRRAINTTWAVYQQALIDNGLNPAHYDDMRQSLEGKEAEFYMRVYQPTNKVMLEQLVQEARTTAREMHKKGGVDRTRTVDHHCNFCAYFMLCNAELRGLDTDLMLKHDYTTQERD